MIKVYKLKSKEDINEHIIRVPQKYRFTPNKEYIGREFKYSTMTIYDDIGNGIEFENGRRSQQFGGYTIDWFENIRNGKPLPYKKGKIAYYPANNVVKDSKGNICIIIHSN